MNILAIIPARGGSKGIPRKNILPLAGKPLIAHSIIEAKQSKYITRVVVSTDSEEIAEVSRQYGAEVVRRPDAISGDSARSEDAILHVLDELTRTEGYVSDIITFIQCTSPLTIAEDMDGAIRTVLVDGADTGLTVMPFHYFLWKPDASGDAIGINHDKSFRLLRQQREDQFLETGAVYVMRTQGFLEAKQRFFGRTGMHVMPAERRLEIDEPVDFQVAEILMRERYKAEWQTLARQIKVMVLDFDGVFTDNKVLVQQDGTEAVWSNRSDGWGIARLKESGMPIMVLSTEANPVVAARCGKLKLEYVQGLGNKLEALQRIAAERGWVREHIGYVGNDVNDLDCLGWVGIPIAVADAVHEVREIAVWTTEKRGGEGAIREITDAILAVHKGGGA